METGKMEKKRKEGIREKRGKVKGFNWIGQKRHLLRFPKFTGSCLAAS